MVSDDQAAVALAVEVVVIGRKGVFQKQQLIQPLGHRMQLVDQGLLAFGELAHAAFPTAMCFPSNAARNASAPASPIIAPAMVSAWLTAFTVSFDEFALALFLAGTQPTFPVYLFSQLRFANRLPIMIALAVLLMIGTLTLVFISERIRGCRVRCLRPQSARSRR